jgi:DNA primase
MWLDDFVAATQAMDERVQEALYARGVTDEQIALYHIGHLDRKLPAMDYPKPFLDWCFGGAKLDDVLVLPLSNSLGQIKGLQFRHVDRSRPGYMDFMPEKGEAVLFGLGEAMHHIWLTRRILLVEGAFDLFPLQRLFPECVATLTAHVLETLIRVLRRVRVEDIWLGYDSDNTGRDSSQKVKKQLGGEFRVHILNFPRVKMVDSKLSKDPSDLWETWGEGTFVDRIGALIKRAGSLEEVF